EVLKQFGTIVDEHRPSLVIVAGASDSALACALAASKKQCRVVHVDAGSRAPAMSPPEALNSALIDRVAELFYPSDTSGYVSLIREGIAEANVQHVGNLLVDATRMAASLAPSPQALLHQAALSSGYGWVMLDDAVMQGDRDSAAALLSTLLDIGRDIPLVWPMSPLVEERLKVFGLRQKLLPPRLSIVAPVNFIHGTALLGGAAFVVTTSRDVQLQAGVLQVRCLLLSANQRDSLAAVPPRPPESEAAKRIAEHLAAWLPASVVAAAG
ncbi:MAG TPA: UDP-N-acetylglucosamine 2-epimerase, partial [Albitalea sp.]|nr:UDP-N-acetylglucosamine 2-epimerase [Albitalea sp.]